MIFAILCSIALAGEPVKKGFVVKEDSYLFTIPEAQQLMSRVSDLEKTEKLYKEQVELISVFEEKEVLHNSIIETKNKIIEEHQKLLEIERERMEKLEKKQKWNDIRVYAAIFLGATLTMGSFVVADNITDTLERN